MATTGTLALSAGSDGSPVLPPALIADIAGGTYPAMINILLALRQRDQTGNGVHLDVAMADNLFTFQYWGLGNGALGAWPRPAAELITGATPRYQIYRTSDGRHIAAAPLEQNFWQVFCDVIELPSRWRDDRLDPIGTRAAIADLIGRHGSSHWRHKFEGTDACAVVVNTLEEAAAHPHFRARGLLARQIVDGARSAPAWKVPLDSQFVRENAESNWPALGEANELLGRRS